MQKENMVPYYHVNNIIANNNVIICVNNLWNLTDLDTYDT